MKHIKTTPLKISVIYLVFGACWIIISDIFVHIIHSYDAYVFKIDLIKGLIFVILSSSALYFISKNYLSKIDQEITQKLESQNRLRKEQDKFRGIADLSPTSILILDKIGSIIYANKEAVRILDLSSDKNFKEYSPEAWIVEDIKGNKIEYDELPFVQIFRTKKQLLNQKYKVRLPSEKEIFISVNAAPVFKHNTTDVENAIIVVRDITENIEYEKLLIESRATYRGIIDSVKEAIFVQDFNKRIIDANKRAEIMYGYKNSELVGKTPMDLGDPEKNDFKEIKSIYNEAINGKMKRFILWSINSKGETFPVEINLTQAKYFDKEVILSVARDVTERFQMEKNLKENEDKYRRVFENIIDVYFETKLDGEIVEISPSIKFLSNGEYERESLIGTNIIDIYYDKSERQLFKDLLLDKKQLVDYEIRFLNKNGEGIYCSITAKLNKVGCETRIVGTIRDINLRKNYEFDLIAAKEKAERAEQLKSEFLAQMSHEFRSPLNIIMTSNELIKAEIEPSKINALSDIFSILNSSIQRLTRTVESILTMAELQSGGYEVEITKFNLKTNILENLIAEYSLLAKEKNIEISLTNLASNLVILADEYSIGQIFSNLIDNAIKYTDKGKVEIIIYNDENKLKVDVKDTGIGIEKEFIPFLFDAFRQEHQGYSRKFDGNGLGLSLVKKFCQINNADIFVKSKKDIGTKFTIIFNLGDKVN